MNKLERRFPRYSQLLRLYPPTYEKQYKGQMLQTLADMLDDSPSKSNRLLTWTRVAIDLPISVSRQQLSYTGGIMAHEIPTYVKRSSAASALLLIPFFAFISINSFSHRALDHSWLWSTAALTVWLVILPALAALVCGATFLKWSVAQRAHTKLSLWRSLLDVAHNWPLIIVGALSLGILLLVFGHDSMHCISGNPIRELHNPHATWQCIQRG